MDFHNNESCVKAMFTLHNYDSLLIQRYIGFKPVLVSDSKDSKKSIEFLKDSKKSKKIIRNEDS